VRTTHKLCGALLFGAVSVTGIAAGAAPAQASTVVASMYEHRNYGGSRLNATMPDGFACTQTLDDVDAYDIYIGANWENRVSSFRGYSNCDVMLFDNANLGGISYGYYTYSSGLGAFDNRAVSYQFS
jgi:hypothetical protein